MLAADVEATAGAFRLRAAVDVERGRTLVLFGASGAGKSLLLRVIAGIHPARGRISLDGEALLDSARDVEVPPQRRRLGYVPQNYALFPHLSVADNVAFGLRGRPQRERRRRVDELLDQLELDGMAGRRPAQLSGGQQQRVALARALATDPAALLLDEPFAALDAPLRRVLRRELQTLRHRYGFAVILVTHDLADACALGDAIAVVAGGEIVQIGPPEEVLTRPATPLVARLTGMRNVFPGRVVRSLPGALEVQTARFTVRTPPFPFPAGAAVYLYVRPDAVTLVREGDWPPSRRTQRSCAGESSTTSTSGHCTPSTSACSIRRPHRPLAPATPTATGPAARGRRRAARGRALRSGGRHRRPPLRRPRRRHPGAVDARPALRGAARHRRGTGRRRGCVALAAAATPPGERRDRPADRLRKV